VPDQPQWVVDKCRGWESINCAKSFADHAGYMAKHLGRSLAGMFTMNEFMCFAVPPSWPSKLFQLCGSETVDQDEPSNERFCAPGITPQKLPARADI
jgi:beta-glucosidase/6-phospho-beta-glucosidase/beta-galactosidase